MRTVVRVSMALVAVAAAALSFVSLWRLGQLAGYGALSALFPIVVDLGAASCCAAWLHTRSRQASVMTWALLALSVVLNGTVHFLESSGLRPGWALVVGVAAIPPLTLGLVIHLAISMDRETPVVPAAEASSDGPELPVEALSVPVWHEETPEPEVEPRTEPQSSPDPVAELIDAGAGRRRIARELGVSEHTARQLLASRNGATR